MKLLSYIPLYINIYNIKKFAIIIEHKGNNKLRYEEKKVIIVYRKGKKNIPLCELYQQN